MHVTKVVLSSPLNGTLDPFLMESFGVEENGMALTVLSALARLGLDPWAEAGHLAALPKQAAAALIARHLALNGDPMIADRLAGLLPERSAATQTVSRTERIHNAVRRDIWLWITFWLAACVFFVSITGPHQSAERATESTAASSNGPAVSGTR